MSQLNSQLPLDEKPAPLVQTLARLRSLSTPRTGAAFRVGGGILPIVRRRRVRIGPVGSNEGIRAAAL